MNVGLWICIIDHSTLLSKDYIVNRKRKYVIRKWFNKVDKLPTGRERVYVFTEIRYLNHRLDWDGSTTIINGDSEFRT